MKKLAKIILPLAAVILSGCMRVGVEVEVRKDGTAGLTARYGMSTAYASEDDFKEEGREPIHFTADGTEYVGYEEKEDYESYEQLSSALTELSEDGSSLFTSADIKKKNGLFTTNYTFDASSAALVDESADYGEISSLIIVDFTLKMPGKVKNVTGGEILEDGTVKFLFAPEAGNTFHAESSELNVVNVLIAAGIVCVILIVAGVILSKKKN